MSKTYFARLFDNANEGESKGPIIGHLPEWFLTQRTRIIYNGPVGICAESLEQYIFYQHTCFRGAQDQMVSLSRMST